MNRPLFCISAAVILLLFNTDISIAQQNGLSGTIVLGPSRTEARVSPAANRYRRAQEAATNETSQERPILVWLESATIKASAQSEPAVLNQVNQQFEPRLVVVRAGERVRVLNSDPIYHNVFSLSGIRRFDIGRRPRGAYDDVQFDNPGEVTVFCDIHPSMSAVIMVLPETAYRWVVTTSGTPFSLDSLAEGRYTLHVYAPGYRPHQRPIVVSRDMQAVPPILLEAE